MHSSNVDRAEGAELGPEKKLGFSAVVALALYAFFELACFVTYFAVSGEPFSFDSVQAERDSLIAARNSADVIDEEVAGPPDLGQPAHLGYEVLHPYLGYTTDPSGPEPLTSSHDRPVIGIFGGSVAYWFARSGALERALRRLPEFAEREVVIVNLAHGGYKQPQQLMSLAYWFVRGGEFDVVVNLDGFNEVALHRTENGEKNIAAVYPRAWYARTQKVPDPKLRRLVGKLSYLESERTDLASGFSARFASWSVAANLVSKARDRWIGTEIAQAQTEFQQYQPEDVPPMVSGPAKQYANDGEMYRDLVAIWKSAGIQMHRLSVQNGIRYLHFVQPNQYVPNSKPMGSQERRLTYGTHYRRRIDVEKGYPLLLSEAQDLIRQGIEVHDLTMIFADVWEPVYIDNCCHVNDRGNDLMAREIALRIVDNVPSGTLALAGRSAQLTR